MSQLLSDLCQVKNSKLRFFGAILFKFKSCLNRRFSMKTIHLWPKMKQLIAVSQKNKIVYYVPFYNFKTYSKILTSNKFHFKTCASEHKLKLTLFHYSLLMISVTLIKEKMHCRWVKLL